MKKGIGGGVGCSQGSRICDRDVPTTKWTTHSRPSIHLQSPPRSKNNRWVVFLCPTSQLQVMTKSSKHIPQTIHLQFPTWLQGWWWWINFGSKLSTIILSWRHFHKARKLQDFVPTFWIQLSKTFVQHCRLKQSSLFMKSLLSSLLNVERYFISMTYLVT